MRGKGFEKRDEELKEADAAFEDLNVDANNGIDERIDNKPTQVAPIIKVDIKPS